MIKTRSLFTATSPESRGELKLRGMILIHEVSQGVGDVDDPMLKYTKPDHGQLSSGST